MAIRTTLPRRTALMGLAVAGALAGTAGAASAQYYGYDDAPYLEQRFGYGYRYAVPRPPAPIPPRAASRIAARDFGLVQIDRTVTTASAYVVDGRTRSGARVRLILDPYSGQLLDEIVLQGPRRSAPRVARTDPREEVRPRQAPRSQQPPERPAVLKPPGQATAPATIIPPAPATPPRTEPAPAPEKPPAAASAPATETPAAPAAPPRAEPTPAPDKPPAAARAPATETPPAPTAPAPGPGAPATAAPTPRLVNPSDVRGTEPGEAKPPLARSESGIPAQLPPVQPQDATPTTPRPQTPDVPVTPLD